MDLSLTEPESDLVELSREFATKEIARLMDAPLGTILARLHRGRRLLEREMWTYAQEAGLLTKERAEDE